MKRLLLVALGIVLASSGLIVGQRSLSAQIGASSTVNDSAGSASSEGAPAQQGSMKAPDTNPFEQEPTLPEEDEGSIAPEQEPVQYSSSAKAMESSAPTQDNNERPTFYRSGEQIEANPKPVQESSAPTSVFEEPKTQSSVSTEPEPEPEVLPEEPEVPPEQNPEEELQEAAPKKSMLMALVGQMKYIIGIVGLVAAGGFLLVLKKKTPSNANSDAAKQSDTPQAPEQQMVEKSSERLEHALNSAETPDSPSGDDIKPPEQK